MGEIRRAPARLHIAADTGGTFTDFVALSADSSELLTAKALTTYDAPRRGLLDGAARANVRLQDADSLKLGTTLVINAFLQRRGAATALLCTRGFRDTLEIRRGNRVTPFDLNYRRDPALVPRERRHEITERIDAQGAIVVPLATSEIEAVAETLKQQGVEAVAVSFLNAYANDKHEQLAAQILRYCLPGVFITTGSSLSREWYEYERTATAAANAYVGPTLDAFLRDLEDTLHTTGFRRRAYIMGSNGGIYSMTEARRQPVQLVESGPVGGCIGAAAYARALGLSKVIAFDMGGTTAKCALIEDGQFETKSPYYVGGIERGFPIRGSVVDIIEVGAGGGSIAAIDSVGRLTVGPTSAGSTPGPACYGRGGQAPTITDANVVLGRIGAQSFLGGEMPLDLAAAKRAITDHVAQPLGYDSEQLARVAQGILDIGALTMSTAIAQITTERGLDPRDFVLFVFGGGGPVHGVELARHIGIPRVLVPPHPGQFSAIGMLLADARSDDSRTFLAPLDDHHTRLALDAFASMQTSAANRLPEAVLGDATSPHVDRYAELRYKGQRHTMKTSLREASNASEIRLAFETAYRARFGHADPSSPVEFVALGVTLSLPMQTFTPASMKPTAAAQPPVASHRPVYFAQAAGFIDTPVLQRLSLPIGYQQVGPAIVEEYGSSTIVGPGDRLEVGALGEMHIHLNSLAGQ